MLGGIVGGTHREENRGVLAASGGASTQGPSLLRQIHPLGGHFVKVHRAHHLADHTIRHDDHRIAILVGDIKGLVNHGRGLLYV